MSARSAIATLICAAAVMAGCGNASESTGNTSESTGNTAGGEATYKPPTSNVSPACETVREELASEEGSNPPGNGKYLTEDREMVQEECGATARKRWARVKNESPEETQCKTAKMLLKEAEAENIQSYVREGQEMVSSSCGE